jgi:RNA polymerase sigma factor for flagellar operon FliA
MTASGYRMYSKSSKDSQYELIERYAPLVKRIAYHLLARLPASVQVEDLIQAGMIGLLEVSTKYDSTKGASFETYAGIRIRGAMLDEVRKGDWAPRSVHRNTRMVSDAIRAIEAKTGRDAKDHEVAAELQLSLDDYYGILNDTLGSRLFSFDDLLQDGEHEGLHEDGASQSLEPSRDLEDERFQSALADAIANLPERERLVLALYYDEELNLKEIGEVLGVSESRVSQLLSQRRPWCLRVACKTGCAKCCVGHKRDKAGAGRIRSFKVRFRCARQLSIQNPSYCFRTLVIRLCRY